MGRYIDRFSHKLYHGRVMGRRSCQEEGAWYLKMPTVTGPDMAMMAEFRNT